MKTEWKQFIIKLLALIITTVATIWGLEGCTTMHTVQTQTTRDKDTTTIIYQQKGQFKLKSNGN